MLPSNIMNKTKMYACTTFIKHTVLYKYIYPFAINENNKF